MGLVGRDRLCAHCDFDFGACRATNKRYDSRNQLRWRPGALTEITLAVLTTGSYGGSGSFILTIAAMVNLIVYTLVVVSVIRAFRAVRKRAH